LLSRKPDVFFWLETKYFSISIFVYFILVTDCFTFCWFKISKVINFRESFYLEKCNYHVYNYQNTFLRTILSNNFRVY